VFIPRSGHLLHSVEFGAGEPVFIAHGGWVGSWELWEESFGHLHHELRCIAYDHRGSGASTFGPETITPEALVDDLFAVMDAHGVARCVLAGESLGALTCMTAVLRAPERFTGLVLVDGVPAAIGPPPELVAGSRADYPATVAAFVDACVPEPDCDHIRAWGRQILLRADPESAARILEAHHDEQVAPEAERIAVPTLILHGEDDVIVPVAAARGLAARIPDSSLVVLPETGHVPTLTRPDAVATAIREWLAHTQAATA
jgi:pimeloyl-ACP methyl ester carboxylesterase